LDLCDDDAREWLKRLDEMKVQEEDAVNQRIGRKLTFQGAQE
jgi:hypothetical protein